jgi:ribosomal protein S14
LRAPVARAMVEALRQFNDPRDRGRCDHCGGRRLDDNFLCRNCGRPSGVFGQMLLERASRHVESEAVGPAPYPPEP